MKKQIVFVESSPTDLVTKMASLLRKRGYSTHLITLVTPNVNAYLKEAYNEIYPLHAKFFKIDLKNSPKILYYGLKKSSEIFSSYKKIKHLKPDFVIGRAVPNWLCVLTKKYFNKSPFVYFPYDIRSFCYESREEAKKEGVPTFELNAERYCFENADGIIHKGADSEMSFLDPKVLGRKPRINCPVLHFLPYCSDELIQPVDKKKIKINKKKNPSIVFVGHIGFEDSWYNSIRQVIDNKIHLHLYGKTANVSDRDVEVRKRYNDLLNNHYFHLHKEMDQKSLIKEISKYNYGIWPGYYDINRKNVFFATGNKIASYFEAGLPIIHFKNQEYVRDLFKKYNAGVTITIDMPLKKVLESQNYGKLARGVIKARNELKMNNNIPRLERFLEAVKKRYENKRR